MYHINEKYVLLDALTPQSVAAAGTATGTFADLQSRHAVCVAVQLGAVAADKSVKVELMTSDAADGTDAKVWSEEIYTAPAGGVTSHVVEISGFVTAQMGRYLGVKVTNQGAAAVLVSALLMADHTWYPEKVNSEGA